MGLAESMLPEFDHEMANTRKTLERVPDEKLDWKPHEKSTAMGGLASHLSNLPVWASLTSDQDEFDMAPGGKPLKSPPCQSRREVLDNFDKNIAAARAAIVGASDEHLFNPWTLLSDGNK